MKKYVLIYILVVVSGIASGVFSASYIAYMSWEKLQKVQLAESNMIRAVSNEFMVRSAVKNVEFLNAGDEDAIYRYNCFNLASFTEYMTLVHTTIPRGALS